MLGSRGVFKLPHLILDYYYGTMVASAATGRGFREPLEQVI